MRAQGAILTYDQLAERTRQTVVTNNTLALIKHIRRKLKLIDKSFDGLINVYGTGYRWEIRLNDVKSKDQAFYVCSGICVGSLA